MSIDIYPKRPSQKEVDFYIAKARKMRAEALTSAGRAIADDIRSLWQRVTGHRYA